MRLRVLSIRPKSSMGIRLIRSPHIEQNGDPWINDTLVALSLRPQAQPPFRWAPLVAGAGTRHTSHPVMLWQNAPLAIPSSRP